MDSWSSYNAKNCACVNLCFDGKRWNLVSELMRECLLVIISIFAVKDRLAYACNCACVILYFHCEIWTLRFCANA